MRRYAMQCVIALCFSHAHARRAASMPSGESMGFRNVIIRWSTQHLSVILLSSRHDPEPYRTALAIGEQFLRH